jgi:hypothetical protein
LTSKVEVLMRAGNLLIVMVSGIGAVVLGLLLWWMPADEAEAGKSITTPEAAATAGARISPTEPPLRIEPK